MSKYYTTTKEMDSKTKDSLNFCLKKVGYRDVEDVVDQEKNFGVIKMDEDGFVFIDSSNNGELYIRGFSLNKPLEMVASKLVREIKRYANNVACKKVSLNIHRDSDWELSLKAFRKYGFMIDCLSNNGAHMVCFTNETYVSIARALEYLERLAGKNKVYTYFSKRKDCDSKQFMLDMDKVVKGNISSLFNSPKLEGAIMLYQEMSQNNLNYADFIKAIRLKRFQPEYYEKFKSACPRTFEKFEKQISEIFKCFETNDVFVKHLQNTKLLKNLEYEDEKC